MRTVVLAGVGAALTFLQVGLWGRHRPDLALALAVYVAFSVDPLEGMLCAFCAGLVRDGLSVGDFGLFGLINLLAVSPAALSRRFLAERLPAKIGLVLAACLSKELLMAAAAWPDPPAMIVRAARTVSLVLLPYAICDAIRERAARARLYAEV